MPEHNEDKQNWEDAINDMIKDARDDPESKHAFPFPADTVIPPVEMIPFDPTKMHSTMPVGKPKKTKSKAPVDADEGVYAPSPSKVKLAKLEEAAKTVLAQYKKNHKELRYPGMQDLSDALDLPNS